MDDLPELFAPHNTVRGANRIRVFSAIDLNPCTVTLASTLARSLRGRRRTTVDSDMVVNLDGTPARHGGHACGSPDYWGANADADGVCMQVERHRQGDLVLAGVCH